MEKWSQTFRDPIGIFNGDLRVNKHPHVQEKSEALIKSAVQLTRYEKRMVFIWKVQRLRSSEALSNFCQLKVSNWPLFIAGWCCSLLRLFVQQISEKMKCPFSCRPWKFGWWPENRPGKHSHHGRSYEQGGRLSETWLPCDTSSIREEGGCQRWNSMDNCSRDTAEKVCGKCALIGFRSNSMVSKRN